MLPKRTEWKKWGALNRATYLAQLLAPVSLIVASMFSYLSWREARHSSELQQTLFAAQNSPRLTLANVRVSSTAGKDPAPALLFALKNEGESDAQSACLDLLDSDLKPLTVNCETKGPFGAWFLGKQEVFTYVLPIRANTGRRLGVTPREARVLKQDQSFVPCAAHEEGGIIIASYRYSDVLGTKRQMVEQVLLCGDKPAPEAG